MKPRNAFERKAMEIHPTLPPLTPAQRDYAIRHCFKHEAIIRKKDSDQYICLECGETFTFEESVSPLAASLLGKKIVCPHCGKKLDIKLSRRRMMKKVCETFQILTTAWEFQITRTFYAFQYTIPGQKAHYEISEVSQIYQMPGRRDICVALPRYGMSYYQDIYKYDANMTIKYNPDDYELHATAVYPRQKILPIIMRNGYCKELKKSFPAQTFSRLLNNPEYETLAKTKRFDIWFGLGSHEIRTWWPQVKMLIRHDYHAKDLSMWKDTLQMAEQLGLDTHSPKYVLPEDLKGLHDTLNRRIQERRRIEEAERKRKEMEEKKEYERLYKKYNSKLLAVVIVSGDITITPLQNYKEFVAEGKAMHHCVETYWGRKESFILSAKCGKKRLATIELDRQDFHVKQCRAACNEVPERYDEIINILNQKKNVFIKAQRARKAS